MKKSIFKAIENASMDGIAIEALMQVELEVLNASKEEMDELLQEIKPPIDRMAYKDDYGYWRVTGDTRRFEGYDELIEHYPNID